MGRYSKGWRSGARKRFKLGKRVKEIRRVYGTRNRILNEMGYKTYADYLASDLWKSIRQRVHERDSGRCAGCGEYAEETHHTAYTRAALLGTDLRWIIPVCGPCHSRAETTRKGKKVPLQMANEYIAQRAAKRERNAKTLSNYESARGALKNLRSSPASSSPGQAENTAGNEDAKTAC